MKSVIRLGDPTSHGGKVVEATSRSKVMDLPVARVGDRCSCPIPGHRDCTIIEGDPNVVLDGISVAFEGHKVSCGAVLSATATHIGRR